MKIGIKKLAMSALLPLALFAGGYSDYSYNNNCCDNTCCDNDCCNDCFSGYVMFENVFLRPYFTRNNAYFLDEPNGIDGQFGAQFDWDYVYTPRVEVGIGSLCGVGIRGRYWRFDHDTTLHAVSTDGNIVAMFAQDSVSDDLGFDDATNARFRHDMRFDVADFEFYFDKCNWLLSFGGRYVDSHQKYVGVDLSTTDLNTLVAEHSFRGVGLTAALEYMHPIKCGFSLYGKGRASLVFGDSDWKAYNTPLLVDATTIISTTNKHDFLPIVELQFGIDWRKSLWCDVVGFIRLGVEAQYWGSAGAAGPGSNAVFDEGNYQNSNPEDSDLGLVGFNVSVGLEF